MLFLEKIGATEPPKKIKYFKGERLNLDGLIVSRFYMDGYTKRELVGYSDVRGYNVGALREQTITVTSQRQKGGIHYVDNRRQDSKVHRYCNWRRSGRRLFHRGWQPCRVS
jgi:hypothetical protein